MILAIYKDTTIYMMCVQPADVCDKMNNLYQLHCEPAGLPMAFASVVVI